MVLKIFDIDTTHHDRQLVDHGAGVGPGDTLLHQGQASTFLLLDHGEVWGSPGSVEAYGSP